MAWTAGFSTTFTGPTRSPPGWQGSTDGAHMTTRRWYYLIPVVRHAARARARHRAPQSRRAARRQDDVFAGAKQLEAGLDHLLRGVPRVAMEYSPQGAIPYLSRVDAGTAELIRSRGIDIVSSGDLVQRFEATWTPAQLRDAHARVGGALSHQGSRVRARAPGAAKRRAADRVRPSAADGRLVRGRRTGQRFGARRRLRRQRRQSALSAVTGARRA